MSIAKPIGPITPHTVTMFQDRISVDQVTGCHNWTGTLHDNGYGVLRVNGRQVRAHRLAVTIATGQEIPCELEVDHLCRNRACVNPAHLEPVTPRENTLRSTGPSALNAVKFLCPRGHTLTDDRNLIPSLRWKGRACRACDNAARRARHLGLTGAEREQYIVERSNVKYAALLGLVEEVAA